MGHRLLPLLLLFAPAIGRADGGERVLPATAGTTVNHWLAQAAGDLPAGWKIGGVSVGADAITLDIGGPQAARAIVRLAGPESPRPDGRAAGRWFDVSVQARAGDVPARSLLDVGLALDAAFAQDPWARPDDATLVRTAPPGEGVIRQPKPARFSRTAVAAIGAVNVFFLIGLTVWVFVLAFRRPGNP